MNSTETIRFKHFELTFQSSRIALLKIDSPEKVNLISTEVLEELSVVLDHIYGRSKLRGLVIYSGKPSGFIVGADIKEIVKAQSMDKNVAFVGSRRGKEVFARLAAWPYPKVAAIHGRCLGGGLELALACDFRVATDDENTLLGLPEVALGVLPGWGGCYRSTHLIGLVNAAKLVLSPLKPWSAKKAWRLGLVSEVVPVANLLDRAQEIAADKNPKQYVAGWKENVVRWATETYVGRKLVAWQLRKRIQKETGGKYPATFAAADVLVVGFALDQGVADVVESYTFAHLCHTPESKEAVQTFLNRKSAPKS